MWDRGVGGGFFIVCICKQSGIPLIWSPMGQKTLAVSTGGHIKEGFFYKKTHGSFCKVAKKSGHNNEVAVLPRWP